MGCSPPGDRKQERMTHQTFGSDRLQAIRPFTGAEKLASRPRAVNWLSGGRGRNGYEEEGCEEGEEGDQEEEVSQRLTIRTRFLGGLRAPFFYALTTPTNRPVPAVGGHELYLD